MIKILISCLIPIILFFSFVALSIGFEGGYRSDKLNYFCFCLVVGGAGLILLIMAASIVYGMLFG